MTEEQIILSKSYISIYEFRKLIPTFDTYLDDYIFEQAENGLRFFIKPLDCQDIRPNGHEINLVKHKDIILISEKDC
ncbi:MULTISPECIES: hypothetical protein [unclassified Francisella]|uniref:hypothetical protein n=1 Tax=unclassified Francisella TaxID=2610885 RepID=UPI002E353832|nr:MULTISPECIES: hypothetical protein [unclassified Francisella]MED7820405.1 hypothetical protein [Francisella sp. 19S2-4]MED7831240.1 hypothetical protein [Francisella sp. 19S2-10]